MWKIKGWWTWVITGSPRSSCLWIIPRSAIDGAEEGDHLVVHPGTYPENIDFKGKGITLSSSDGPLATVLDGGGQDTVVAFRSGEGADSILDGFTITHGKALQGGGILCRGASPTIHANVIRSNSAVEKGGGIACLHVADPRIEANRILENEAGTGGGIACEATSPLMINNFVYRNSADTGGGLSVFSGSAPVITGNTVIDNSAISAGGGLWCPLNPPQVANTILWGNNAPTGPQILGDPAIDHCDVQGGWSGPSIIDADPLFVNPFQDDFRISIKSPCLEKGTNLASELPDVDFENDERIIYSNADIGADECSLGGGMTLHVPADYSTILAAIETAKSGDLVIVNMGTYHENVDFLGKDITLTGTDPDDPAVVAGTVIDGGQVDSVIRISDCSTGSSRVMGFTIRNGQSNKGGGIYCEFSSPVITDNVFRDNVADEGGGSAAGMPFPTSAETPSKIPGTEYSVQAGRLPSDTTT